MKKILLMLSMLMWASSFGYAEEEMPENAAPSFVVVMPEKVGEDTYIPFGGGNENTQHIVQTEIEKSMVRKQLNVIDVASLEVQIEGGLSWQVLSVQEGAMKVAREVNADYLVYGQATAVRAGTRQAYGVTATRAQVDITSRIIRVSDGKILEVFDATAVEGNAAFGVAANDALKSAGKSIAKKISMACVDVIDGE